MGFRVVALICLAACMGLVACGKKDSGPVVSTNTPSPSADLYDKHETVASKLGDYSVFVDLERERKDLNEPWWRQFRADFMRALASDVSLKDEALALAAFEDVGREPDAFRRDDRIKAHAGDIAALRKQATTKLQVGWGLKSNQGLSAIVLPYDMQTESYKVQLLNLGDAEQGYDFHDGKPASPVERMRISFSARGFYECIKKVPKEQARAIEAKLAPLRGADSANPANIPISAFVTVVKTEQPPTWANSLMNVRVDAVALHLPGSSPKDIVMLLDGPDTAKTYKK